MDFRAPWEAVSGSRRIALEGELARELCSEHVLSSRPIRVVAARLDCDDVLCQLDGGAYAVVHLTYSREPESQPEWPRTRLYASFDACMAKENDDR